MAGKLSSPKTCILAIDDEPGFLGFLKEALEYHGYKVHAASSPEEAIKFYEERWRDVGMIFLDFLLPGKSGDKMFDEFQRVNPDVRIVLLTGCNSAVAEPLFKKGLKGFLPKPFRLPELAQKVQDAIAAPSLGS